jgi:hypothetical protein
MADMGKTLQTLLTAGVVLVAAGVIMMLLKNIGPVVLAIGAFCLVIWLVLALFKKTKEGAK